MGNTFEALAGGYESEISQDSLEFHSAGKKYINQNYKRIGSILGIEGAWLGNIKKQASAENKLPDIQGELSLKQINSYREHYDFPPLTQDEYEDITVQNTSAEVIIDEQVEEATEVDQPEITLEGQESTPTEEVIPANTDTATASQAGVELGQSENVIYNTDKQVTGIDKGLNTILNKYLSQDEINTSDATTAVESKSVTTPAEEEQSVDTETPNPEVDEEQDEETTLENEELSNLPEADALQAELDRLITLESQKLQREQTTENFSYQVDREKLENFKENARQAIANYQQFSTEHSSPLDKTNVELQDKYRQLEKTAWNTLYNLAHVLDGEIATLPQDRDIQLSHPEGVDIRQYLEARGYKFDEKGDITHINDNGVDIELNRAMKIDSLIKSSRPSRILYDKSISLDNDMNYQGYLVRGLNPQTPDFIVGVLDKEHLEPVIVDETLQSNNLSEGVQDPWAEEVKGVTEFDKIFADSLKYNNETQISDEMSDPWVEKSVIEEPPIMPVFPIPSGDNPDLQSEGAYPLGEEGLEATPKVSLDDLRLAYAKAEEAYNRKRGDWDLEDAFLSAREVYNTELERVLKLKVAEGQESSIHDLFKKEVIDLREERITQSKELQGNWEKKLNPLKEKFVNFVMKHKKLMGRVNLALGVAGAGLALTGVGIPLAGGLAVTRRAISGVMLGVSSGEGIRGLGEDTDINWFGGRVKFKAVIPKLVQESLASSEDEFKKVNDDVLKDRLGTLEAYYRLNGGKFTNDDQQKAYEKVLTELGNRVKVNTIENYQNENTSNVEVQQDSVIEQDNQETNSTEQFNSRESRYYVSGMLNTISEKRITDLDKFKINRRNATIAGLGVGILVGGAVHVLDEVNKPDSIDVPESLDAETQINPSNLDSGTDIATPGEDLGTAEAPPAPELPPIEEAVQQAEQSSEVVGSGAEEALRQAAAEQAQELAKDVSSLDPGETIWGEIGKQLGENATDTQIQQAVENLLQSEVGQNSIYELAQGTEGGRTLLVQWGIDNANEMAELSKEQLYEISKYLAPGELEGITELSLDNLNPFDAVESPQVDVSEAMNAPDTSAVEAPTPSVEPTPSAPPEVSPIAGTEFTENLSKALGTNNLTEYQLQEVMHTYVTSEQGSTQLYEYIIKTDEGAGFLDGFGVKNAADFANLSPDELYEIAQIVGVENLDSLPGFELNEIILSRFEDAPDFVELAKGSKPLDVVNRYIANEVGNLPYDASIGQQVLNNYLDTPAGKDWLYEAVINNPDKLNGNQNIQFVEEYFRQNGIKSGADINWVNLTQDKRFPTSIFWRETSLTGGRRIPPLSTLLQPGQMIGIKESIRQVLTKQ